MTVIENTENVQVDVHWQGGHQTHAMITRPVARLEQMSQYPPLMDRVKALHAQGHTAIEMVEKLNTEE